MAIENPYGDNLKGLESLGTASKRWSDFCVEGLDQHGNKVEETLQLPPGPPPDMARAYICSMGNAYVWSKSQIFGEWGWQWKSGHLTEQYLRSRLKSRNPALTAVPEWGTPAVDPEYVMEKDGLEDYEYLIRGEGGTTMMSHNFAGLESSRRDERVQAMAQYERDADSPSVLRRIWRKEPACITFTSHPAMRLDLGPHAKIVTKPNSGILDGTE